MESNHAALAEKLHTLRTIAEVEDFLDIPDFGKALMNRTAYDIAVNLNGYLATKEERDTPTQQNAEIYQLEPSYKALFDPLLKTVAIDVTEVFSGSELVAMAAQQRRVEGKPSCNVILMSSATDCGAIVTDAAGNCRLELARGIMVGPDGLVFVGELPIPATVDVLETASTALLRQCADAGIPTSYDAELVDRHKHMVSHFAEMAGLRSPRRFNIEELWVTDQAAEYVIKPTTGLGGLGVRMFKGAEQKAVARSYYEFLAEHGYGPVIEHRVESWPLYTTNETAGRERMDWNVRALVANGELIDMYIRMGPWGGAINRSQGAEAVSLQDLAAYTDDPETATRLFERLLYAAHDLARKLPPGVAGADLTVGADEEVYIYEANVGACGGLQTIATMHDDRSRKLLGPDLLLEGWLRQHNLYDKQGAETSRQFLDALRLLGLDLDVGLPPPSPIVKSEKLARSLTQLFDGLGRMRAERAMAGIPETDIRALEATHMELACWIESGYDTDPSAHHTPQEYEDYLRELDRRYVRLAPLEFFHRLTVLVDIHPNPAQLLDSISLLEDLFPLDPRGATARMIIYASKHAPRQVGQAITDMISRGIPEKKAKEGAVYAAQLYAYQLIGLRTTKDLPDPHSAAPIYAAYFDGDYNRASELAKEKIAQADDRQAKVLFAAIGAELAFSEGDTMRSLEFLKHLQDSEAIEIAHELTTLRAV
jgi:hypothetical protein